MNKMQATPVVKLTAALLVASGIGANAVVVDISGVSLNGLTPNPIRAGERLTSLSYGFDFTVFTASAGLVFLDMSITLSPVSPSLASNGSGSIPLEGVASLATSFPFTGSGSASGALNFTLGPQVPASTPSGDYLAFLEIIPRSPHSDPDGSGDAIGQHMGLITVVPEASHISMAMLLAGAGIGVVLRRRNSAGRERPGTDAAGADRS